MHDDTTTLRLTGDELDALYRVIAIARDGEQRERHFTSILIAAIENANAETFKLDDLLKDPNHPAWVRVIEGYKELEQREIGGSRLLLDKDDLHALATVVEHMIYDEEEHYCENKNEREDYLSNHIVHHLRRLAAALARVDDQIAQAAAAEAAEAKHAAEMSAD
jgi:hypothetical protein